MIYVNDTNTIDRGKKQNTTNTPFFPACARKTKLLKLSVEAVLLSNLNINV